MTPSTPFKTSLPDKTRIAAQVLLDHAKTMEQGIYDQVEAILEVTKEIDDLQAKVEQGEKKESYRDIEGLIKLTALRRAVELANAERLKREAHLNNLTEGTGDVGFLAQEMRSVVGPLVEVVTQQALPILRPFYTSDHEAKLAFQQSSLGFSFVSAASSASLLVHGSRKSAIATVIQWMTNLLEYGTVVRFDPTARESKG